MNNNLKQFGFNYKATLQDVEDEVLTGYFTLMEDENIPFTEMRDKAQKAAKESLEYDFKVDANVYEVEVIL